MLKRYRVDSWIKRIELYLIYVQLIYLSSLILHLSLTYLVHESSLTN